MKNNNIIAGAVGGGVSLVFLLGLHLSIPVVLAVGGVSYLATLFATNRPPTKQEKDEEQSIEEEKQSAYNTKMDDAKEKIAAVYSLSKRITNQEVREKAYQVAQIAYELYENLEKNPTDIKYADKFIYYYLDLYKNLVIKYLELAHKNVSITEIKSMLIKIEDALGYIKTSLERLLKRMLADDFLDIDAEISLLKKSVKMEEII